MRTLRLLLLLLSILLLCPRLRVQAQTDYRHPPIPCGFDLPSSGPVLSGRLVGDGYSPYPAAAIVSCGPYVKLYYDDIAEGIVHGIHGGFDDPVAGATRRNTLCMVMDYLQHSFDFSLVNPAHPLRIHLMRSLDPAYNMAPVGTQWLAATYPFYDSSTDGIKDAIPARYIKTGIDDSLLNYHADIQFNFDATFALELGTWTKYGTVWHDNGGTPVNCNENDLYSVFLHEFSHCLGYFSLIWHEPAASGSGYTLRPRISGHHVFSRMDSAVFLGNYTYPLAGGFMPLVVSSGGVPSLNPALPATISNNTWLTNKEAPGNYPVYSGATYPFGGNASQFISHLDRQQYSYTMRARVSPGNRVDFVMGPYTFSGGSVRKYTKGDLVGMHDIIGLPYAATFAAYNPDIHFANTPPYSKKMGQYNITRANYTYFTETVPPDYTLANDIGAYLDIDISAMTDIVDADGDPVSFDTATLVGYRGCSMNGNNHNALQWVVPGKIIRYTPRHNFYGKAQWGCRITDGIDSGSFVVVTIEVKRGTNVGVAAGENMVCNPGFEEGTEVVTEDRLNVPNPITGRYGGINEEGKWQGIIFSDAHPYDFNSTHILLNGVPSLTSGIVVRNSWFVCRDPYKYVVGNTWLSSPISYATLPGIDNPLPLAATGGDRYQSFREASSSYYYLADTVHSCKRYVLEFDLYRAIQGMGSTLHLQIGLTDTVAPLLSYPSGAPSGLFYKRMTDTIASPDSTFHDWVHVRYPFTYCADKASNLLYLHNPDAVISFHIDNLVVREDTSAYPLTVTITRTPATGCTNRLTATMNNTLCKTSYQWTNSGGSIISYAADSSYIIVPANALASYTVTASDGCRTATAVKSISDGILSPISGNLQLCTGIPSILTDTLEGGSWSSANTAIATVDFATGAVTGIAPGTATISYTFCGNPVTAVVTVNASPAAISGSGSICLGMSATLSDATAPGTWSSSDPAVVPVSATGVISALSLGTATITYQAGLCSAVKTVTVNANPAPVTGAAAICAGTSVTLSASGGGTWSSSNTSIVTVNSTGIVTGMSAGTATVAFTNAAGCSATAVMTVLPTPSAIYGDNSVCAGAVAFLYEDVAGGSWSSASPSVATVDAYGIVWAGSSEGTATITYTMPGGCYATYVVAVHQTPAAITVPASICSGATVTLTDTPPGGTWSMSDPAVATIGSTSGIVTAVSAGAVFVTYTSPYGCLAAAAMTIGAPGTISGASSLCMGTTITLSGSGGGTWSSSTPAVATISSAGVVTAVSAGTTTISYIFGTYCYAIKTVTVGAIPSPIFGTTLICAGGTAILYDVTPDGLWSSLSPAVATVTGTGSGIGIVSGISSGTATIVYSSVLGCTASIIVTVTAPSAIVGPSSMCIGSSTTLSNSVAGGAWTSSTPAVASIGYLTGIVYASAAGVTTITYALSPSCYVTKTLTVSANPAAILGSGTICMPPSASTVLTDPTPGGAWSSSNTAVATVISGVVSGVSTGTVTISYTLPSGCYVTRTVTVNASPGPITGTAAFCVGTTTTLSGSAPGGVWTSATPSYASIGSSTGIVTGIIPGTVSISYTFPATGCMVFKQVTVTTTPALSPISGFDHLCIGATITMTDTATGGGWVSSNPSVATIGSDGILTGLSYGTVIVSYVKANACGIGIVTKAVTVNTLPEAIAGANSMCIDTSLHVTLTDATPGGNWSSSNTSVVTIDAGGTLTAIGTGTATITYSMGAGCMATTTVYVGKDDGNCSPCHQLRKRPYTTLGAGGTVTSSIGAGNYYLPNSVAVYGNVNWSNAVLFMAPDIDVYVDPAASLTVAGSHLFSCDKQMWKGITLQSDGSQTARVILKEGAGNIPTLIEDAKAAVTIKGAIKPNSGAAYYVASYNTIFNRNNTGIYIGDYTRTTAATPGADPYAYEFHIENTVFTCRDLNVSNSPFVWPGMAGSSGLKTIAFVSNYRMPYNIMGYPLARCHNLGLNTIGIQAQGVGAGADANFAGLVAGEPSTATIFGGSNTQLNIYDALAYGIYAINANITARNSVFANMRSSIDKAPKPVPDNGLTGIYTAMNNAQKYRLRVEAGIYTYYVLGRPTTVESPNAFYDCGYGVYSKDYYTIKGYKSTMTTGQNDPADKSRYGYYLQSSSYNDVQVTANTIYNVAAGVVFLSTLGAGYWVYPTTGSPYYVAPYQLAGTINVSNNSIKAAYGTTVPTTQFCHAAIWLQNMVNSPKKGNSPPVFAPGTVYTDGNTIRDAYHGIYVQSYWAQQALTRNNNITLASSPVDNVSWGINHTDCAKNMIYGNTVTGSTFATAKPMNDSTRAYYLNYNANQELYCNYATNTGRGFEFALNNPGTYWHHNHMTGNFRGYVLNNAILGQQGGYGNPIENEWHNPSWWSSTTNMQTYVTGQNAFDSRIYVQNTATKKPIANYANPFTYLYSESLSSIMTTNPTPGSTSPCLVWRPAGLSSNTRMKVHEGITQKAIDYSIDSAINDWLAQFTTWQTIKDDSEMLDSSAVLNSFNTLAANSRYATITSLEDALAGSDSAGVDLILSSVSTPITEIATYADSATGVIVADDHTSDYIVDNYKAVYGLYHKYQHGLLTADDSMQVCDLAALCPARYGNAVYRARTLYTLVSGDLHIWNDDSCGGGDTAAIAARHSSGGKTKDGLNAGQRYSLFPNPNNGELTISQLAIDDKPVQVTVFTITGMKIYEGQHTLTNGQSMLKLGSVASGMYMMRITDIENRIFTIKFIVQ